MFSTIPMSMWGRDHWSMLAYVECVCVDQLGVLADARMRSKCRRGWRPEFSTSTRHGIADNHDDYDCLRDLQIAGLVTQRSEDVSISRAAALTDKGREVAAALRAHKAAGGKFADFMYQGELV